MKRFYKTAEFAEAESGYTVTLDGRPIRTPGKALLNLPVRRLAEAIAGEWDGQGERVEPQAMPLTRFANTAIDRVAPRRDAVVGEIAGYAETDLLCHRVETPAELARRQNATWQPILDWAAARFSAKLRVTRDILAVDQPPEALSALRSAVDSQDDFALSALHSLTSACGSVVLGLAVVERRISARNAASASMLDELYQAEQWGSDPEADARRKAILAEIESAARFLEHLTD